MDRFRVNNYFISEAVTQFVVSLMWWWWLRGQCALKQGLKLLFSPIHISSAIGMWMDVGE